MMHFPKRTSAHERENKWPDRYLICDGPHCSERETFPFSTTRGALNNWIKRHGWRTVYRGQKKFHHLCPVCERAARVPQSYIERLSA